MKTIAIIQARLTSKRFPKKVLEKLGHKTILQHVIDATKQSQVTKVVVATPTGQDIPFTGASRFQGSEEDVLDRYYQCATKYEADTIVRITADCPLMQPNFINAAIELYRTIPTSYVKFAPVSGFDVEVFSYRLLLEAAQNTVEIYDREHVTPYMKRKENLSVDTRDDLIKVEKLYADGNRTHKS